MNSGDVLGEDVLTNKQLLLENMQPIQFRRVQESPWEVFKKILFLSFLMIFLPLGLYFLSKTIVFEAILGMTTADSYFYSAIVAIVAAHAVLIAFIFFALKDSSEESKRKLK